MSFVAFSAVIDDRATGTATATAVHGRALSSITLGTGPRGSRVNMASKVRQPSRFDHGRDRFGEDVLDAPARVRV